MIAERKGNPIAINFAPSEELDSIYSTLIPPIFPRNFIPLTCAEIDSSCTDRVESHHFLALHRTSVLAVQREHDGLKIARIVPKRDTTSIELKTFSKKEKRTCCENEYREITQNL